MRRALWICGGGGLVPMELVLNKPPEKWMAIDEPPIRGEFGIPDARIIAPGEPDRSVFYYRMAKSGKYDALVALGAVVHGATPHADLINSQVSRSLAKVGLDEGVPVVNGVVCADNLEQAIERAGTKAGNKGWNAAQAAIEMANLYKAMA